MPRLGESINFNLFGSIDKAEMTMTEVELVESELDSKDLKSEEVGSKSSVIRRILLSVDKLPEQTFHKTLGLLSLTCFVRSFSRKCVLLGWDMLFISDFCILYK